MGVSTLERLKFLREKAGFTMRGLSKKLNRGDSYISKMESGQFSPTFEDIEIIVKECGSTMEEFCYEDFESYALDKEILSKVKDLNKHEKQALITLLVAMYKIKTEDEERVG